MKFHILLFLLIGIIISKKQNYDLEIEYGTPGKKIEKKEYNFKNKKKMNQAIGKQIEKIFPEEKPEEIDEFIKDFVEKPLDILPKNMNDLMFPEKMKFPKLPKHKNLKNNKSFFFKIHTQEVLNPQTINQNDKNQLNNEDFDNQNYEVFENLNEENDENLSLEKEKSPEDIFLDSVMGKIEE